MALRYRGRHLLRRPNRLAKPAAAGTATAVLFAAPAGAATKHRVRAGETLSGVAKRYGVSVTRLVKANDLSDANLIISGSLLRVPGGGSGSGRGGVYTVRPGDTLSAIAARHGTSVGRLVRANRLKDPNLIVAGQRLRVGGVKNGGHRHHLHSRSSIGTMLGQAAQRHGLDPSLVKAVAWQESGWQQHVRSSAGAIGVMQVMPGTARYVNDVLTNRRLNVRRPKGNIELGVTYLHHLSHQMPTTSKTLAAYYTGPGNVERRLSRVQRSYVRSVKALRARF